jgi:F-type H+-transporting ATPase subunit epsilon
VTLQVELVSPEKILYSGQADMVIARTVGGGDIAFLSGHAPFVGALEIGLVTNRSEGRDDLLVAVHGGFVEVSTASAPAGSDGAGEARTTVTILSDVAELPEQIDVDRARRAESSARQLVDSTGEGDDAVAARDSLRRSQVRLQAAAVEVAATH